MQTDFAFIPNTTHTTGLAPCLTHPPPPRPPPKKNKMHAHLAHWSVFSCESQARRSVFLVLSAPSAATTTLRYEAPLSLLLELLLALLGGRT